MPELAVVREDEGLRCAVDGVAAPARATLWVSFDGAYTFQPTAMEGFHARVTVSNTAALEGAALFAEVEYEGGPVLTSLPWLGAAFEQRVRPFPEPKA
jgi:hypothetical protein